jgi:hypothetical protein
MIAHFTIYPVYNSLLVGSCHYFRTKVVISINSMQENHIATKIFINS